MSTGVWSVGVESVGVESVLSVGAGAQTVTPTGIASTLAIGTPKINLSIQSAGGIASTLSIGTPSANLSIQSAGGIASTLLIGTPKANLNIAPSGIASSLAIGTPTVLAPQTIIVSGIASSLAIGTPVLQQAGGAQTIVVGGIASTLAIGSPQVSLEIETSGIASTLQIGQPSVSLSIQGAGGIASSLVVGTPTVVAPQVIVAGGIASTLAIGSPLVTREGDAVETGGGPDASDDTPAERYTADKSGWRKPQWVREREQAEKAATAAAASRSDVQDRATPPAARIVPEETPTSIAPTASGLPRSSASKDASAPIELPAQVADLGSARAAARLRQERELEMITTMLLMAA